MKFRYLLTFLTGIHIVLLTGCGGESSTVATRADNTAPTVDLSETVNTTPATENTEAQNSADPVPLELPVSPVYNEDMQGNALAVTGSGDHWASIWVTEQESGDALHAAVEVDGVWQTPVDLTEGFLFSEIESSENQIMVAWKNVTTDADNNRSYSLQTRVLRENRWQPAFLVDSASGDNAFDEIRETAMTAMPDNRFALLWTAKQTGEAGIRYLREWNTDHWSATQILPVIETVTRDNQLAAAPDGSLSNLYSTSITYDDNRSRLTYWVQDRIEDTWLEPVRVDQVDLPLWLTRFSISNRAMATSSSGRQIIAWSMRLTDSFDTHYYGIASVQRAGPGQAWSSHFELTGNESIEDVEVAMTDDGHTAISWLRKTGISRHELMLSRYTPDAGWLPIVPNIMQPEIFPGLPPEPATYYPSSDRITMETSKNTIRLSLVVEVGYLQTGRYYYSLQSGAIGFGQQPITNATESSRAYLQRLLSCDSHEGRFRCSRSTGKLNRYVATPDQLLTEQIKIIDVAD